MIDVAIVVLAIAAAASGWHTGALRRTGSWIGFAAGIGLGIAIFHAREHGTPPHTTAELLLKLFVVMALAMATSTIGAFIGGRLRRFVNTARLGVADSLIGAALNVTMVLAMLWLAAPNLSVVHGEYRKLIDQSNILGWISQRSQQSPTWLPSIAKELGVTALPKAFEGFDLGKRSVPQIPATGLSPQVTAVVAPSVVKVEANACDTIHSGTGFEIEGDLIVTNAHVVAGGSDIQVTAMDGSSGSATLVAFDPRRDIALLRSTAVHPPGLVRRSGTLDDTGDVLGYPGGGPFRSAPFSISEKIEALGRDLYGLQPTERKIFILGSVLEPGNSGGPVIAQDGSVVGIAYAIARDQPGVAYAIDTSELDAVIAQDHSHEVSAGECIRI